MSSEMNHVVDNIKQEPEVSFKLVLPPEEIEEPENDIKIEENSAEVTVKLKKFDDGRRKKMKLFQTYRKCEKCDLMINMRRFEMHSRKCCGNQKFECDFCGILLKRKQYLPKHLKIHMKNYPLFCDKCEKGFKTKWELVSHQKDNHRKIKCFLCDLKFECMNLKDRHLNEVHKKNLKCPKCEFIGKDYKQLRQHHYSIHNKHLSCETCSKKFRLPFELKDHQLQRKHGIYKNSSITFHCDQCTKSFLTMRYLKEHQRVIHGMEKLQCDLCSKILVSKRQLLHHMRIHVKIPCGICKKIVKKRSFKRHLESHTKPSHKCIECKKSYPTRQGLSRHIKNSHSKLLFHCDLCGRTVNSRRKLRCHFDTHKKVFLSKP